MDTFYQILLEAIKLILAGVAGGLIGARDNDKLTILRDRDQRVREFRNTVSVLLEKFRIAANVDLIFIHQQSVTQLREGCVRVLEDIIPSQKDRVKKTCDGYCGLSQQDIENKDASCIVDSLWGETSSPDPLEMKPLCDYERGRKLILGLLTELRDLSW